MKSPILTRPNRNPAYCILTRVRIITQDDLDTSDKWNTVKKWYQDTEKDPNNQWLDFALHSIFNSILYQERIYFAITRKKLRELFQRDTNWSDPLGLDSNEYSTLIQTMYTCGMFEGHPENESLKKQRKPMIFKVVNKDMLSLMQGISEEDQERQVIDFVKKSSKLDEDDFEDFSADQVADQVADTDSKKVRKTDSKTDSESVLDDSQTNQDSIKINFDQFLLIQITEELPKFGQLEELAKLAITNCKDFDADMRTIKKFEKHLTNMIAKPSPKQKDYIKKLANKFKIEAEKYIKLQEIPEGFSLKEPKQIEIKALEKTIDDSERVQNDTVKILNNIFGRDTIKVLKSKLNKTEDQEERFAIEKEIEFWESTM